MLIHLAGGEQWADTLLKLAVPYQLLSYYYLRSKLTGKESSIGLNLLRKLRVAQKKGYRFMLDSGAFTYIMKGNEGRIGTSLPHPDMYFREYLDFLLEYGDIFHIVCELDIDNAVNDPKTGKPITVRKVDDWTNEMLAVEHLRRRVMPVFHAHRGDQWYSDWLIDTRSALVGISSDHINLGEIQALIGRAHRWGKFVHGFAQTRIKTDMKTTLWDSVDSTTWLRADQFGGTMIWTNNQLVVLDHKHKADRARYRDWFERWGLDMKLVMQDDLETMRFATIITWREMAKSFSQRGQVPYLYKAINLDGLNPTVHPKIRELEREKAAKGLD